MQSAVRARPQRAENPNLNVVAETEKFFASSSSGYQIMDCSRHSVTLYMNDKKTHAAINNNKFKKLGHIGDQLCQVELAKYEIELKESIIVSFFILQCSKLRKLKLFCNFVAKLYNIDNFEKMGTNTDSQFFALAEKEVSECIQKEKTQVGSFCVAKTVKTRSLQALVSVFPPHVLC